MSGGATLLFDTIDKENSGISLSVEFMQQRRWIRCLLNANKYLSIVQSIYFIYCDGQSKALSLMHRRQCSFAKDFLPLPFTLTYSLSTDRSSYEISKQGTDVEGKGRKAKSIRSILFPFLQHFHYTALLSLVSFAFTFFQSSSLPFTKEFTSRRKLASYYYKYKA